MSISLLNNFPDLGRIALENGSWGSGCSLCHARKKTTFRKLLIQIERTVKRRLEETKDRTVITGISLVLLSSFGIWASFLACKVDKKHLGYIIFLLAAGLFRPSGSLPGSFDLSSMWLLLNIALLMLVYLRKVSDYPGVIRIHLIFIFYAIVITIPRIGGTTSLEFSLRELFKQLYPLLALAVTANVFKRKEVLSVAVNRTLTVTFITSICVGGFAEKFWPFSLYLGNFVWLGAALSDHSAIITNLALVWWAATRKKKFLLFASAICASTVLTGNRTGIAATAFGISFFLLLHYKLKSAVPILIALYLSGMSILFLYPAAHGRMFQDPTSVDSSYIVRNPMNIDFNTINSSGRFEMWDYLLDNFWRPRPLFGSGLGAVQGYLYSFQNLTGLNHPHSAYVNILCDCGLIGLCLFILVHMACMLAAYRTLKGRSSEPAKVAARFVICAVPTLLVIMGFDSAISSATAIMQYSFVFTGITIGLSRQKNGKDSCQFKDIR